jgi:hypothetical protein
MNIQQIRQQYPQYNDLSDEQLAQGFHQKFYADLPFDVFAQRIGFAKAAAPSEQVISPEKMLTPITESDAAQALREKTKEYEAGTSVFERAKRDVQRGIISALNIMPQQEVVSRQKEIDRIRAGKAGRTDPTTGEFIPLSPEEEESAIQLIQGEQQKALEKVAKGQAEARAIPGRPVTEAVVKAKTAKEALELAATDPFGAMAGFSLESLPQMAPALGLAAVTKSPFIGATALGGTSFTSELSNSVFEYLDDNGVDINNSEAVLKALDNPDTFKEAYDFALKRAAIIGAVDTASAGLASKLLVPKKLIGNPKAREVVNIAIAQPASQIVSGAGGEAAAQVATYGEVKKPGAVVAEALGEGPTSIAETAAFGGRRIYEELRGKTPEAPEEKPVAEVTKRAAPPEGELAVTPEVPPKGPAPQPKVEIPEEEAPKAAAPTAPAPSEIPQTKEEFVDLVTRFVRSIGETPDPEEIEGVVKMWEKTVGKETTDPVAELETAGKSIQEEIKAESPDTQTYVQKMLPIEVPVAELKLSKDVPQFKSDANEQGVVERLGGKFEREGLAPIQVWERLNGDLEVISGRHRLDLARRSGEQTIPAQVFKESDGFDAKRAAVMDAELNIRDEKGKVKDYVTYFKETKLPQDEAESRGLLARSVGKRAFTIANEGSEELITALRNEAITDEGAFVIAKNAPNDGRLQAVGIQAIQKGLGIGAAANKMQALKALAGEADTSLDMFGFDTGALKEAEEMGKIADRKQREIGTRLAAISGASKNPKLAAQEGINIKDPDAVARRVEELRQLKASWENWPTNPELRDEIRAEMRPAAPAKVEKEELAVTPEVTKDFKDDPKRYEIKKKESFRGRTTPDIEFELYKDGKRIYTFKRRKEAQEMLDVLTLPDEDVYAKYPELRPSEADLKARERLENKTEKQKAEEAEKREEKAIADREVDLFKLQPSVAEKEMPTMGDLFGAKDLVTQPPKRPPILDKDMPKTGLFKSEVIDNDFMRSLPKVGIGDTVAGYIVRKDIPNQSSIEASLDNYEILKGIRQVPFDIFSGAGKPEYPSPSEEKYTKKLAQDIKESGEINPLIVVLDSDGPYILEGAHRWDALQELGAFSFPAMVVLDLDDKKGETQFIEETVKDVAKKLEDDFMIGDQVRVGNSPGVVVGIEGDYIRFHPDSASNPKAYRRIQKRMATFVARPDTKPTAALSTQADQDKKFGEEAGRLNADMGGLIQLLGANMYASNIADVAVKELLQNAFDAVKGAISSKNGKSLYKTGSIEIMVNPEERTIQIKDNARGMTPAIVRDAFFTVAGSDKSDLDPQERSGGLGLAKMGFMLGSEQLKLETVRDGVKVTVDTTAKDIANSNFTINKSPAPKDEHGTTVTVKIPEKYTDPKTGDQKDIWFPWSKSSIQPLSQPLIGPVDVKLTFDKFGSVETETLPIGTNFPADKYQQFKVNFDWGTADIYFGIDRKEYPEHKVLSSGVYQFDDRFMLSDSEKVPFDIVVNIKSNVEAKHPDYPFENSRERFKGRLEKDVKALAAYLAQIARGNEMKDLQDNFKNIVSMPRLEVGKETAETAKKLKQSFEKKAGEKVELPPFPSEVRVTGDKVIDLKGVILVDTAKEAEKKKEATFEAEKAAPKREEFMLQIPQDPKNPIFHNNTNVDFIEIGEKYGDPMAFFSELGTLMVEMKEALGKSGIYKYDVLTPENLFFGGISIDTQYGGVHIKVPYKAVLLNPFYNWGAKTLFGIRANLLNTMIHEIAHTGSMGHEEAFINNMLKVEQFLEDEGLTDYFRDALMDILVRHESVFTAMREAYGKSTTKNTSKSLKDYEKSKSSAASRRVEPSGEGEDWVNAAGGGQERDESVRARGRRDKESGVGGRAGEDARKLLDETGRVNTPMLDQTPIKRAIMNVAQDSKTLFNESVENPRAVISNMAGSVDRGILYLRNKNVWFGSGLNAADFERYNGQLRTSEGMATGSVALDNAIRGGNIYVQVIMEGGIEWNDSMQNFVAATRDYSMKNVYIAEAALKKQIGEQTAQDLIQGYLEAKRSRSIQNEYYKRSEDVQLLEEALDRASNPADVKRLQDNLLDAQEDMDRVQVAFDKIAMTDDEIDSFIEQEKKFTELREIMDNWTGVNQNLLAFWRQAGILSERRYEQLSSIKDYVPWQRIMSVEEDPHSPVQSTTKTMTNVGKERIFKKGVPKVTTSFIAKEGQKAFQIQPSSVVAATVNGKRVPKDKFVVDSDGKVQLNVPIDAGDVVVFEGLREIENIIDNMTRNVGMMVMNGLRNYAGVRIATEYGTKNDKGELKTFKRPDRDGGVFNILIDGRRVNIQVPDPLIAEAAIGMETMNLEAVRLFGALANITRRSITLSGTFQIKQVFKDAPTAALVTGVKRPDLLIGGVYKGFVSALAQSDPAFDILRKAGIGGFHSPARTPEAEVKRQIGIINRSVYDWTISLLDRFGDSADYAQRIATYNRVLKETGDEAQALFQAANVINFLHHGSGQLAQAAVRTVPFLGAYANSIDVLVQAAAGGGMKGMSRKKALKRVAMTGGLLVGATLLYAMLLGADDDYWELDDETRLKNFIVPFLRAPDGSMIMMPMNTSAAFFFKAIPELIYHKVVKEGTKSEPDARRMRKALANAAADTLLGPTPLPAALKPSIEIALNYNFFTGRTIVPRGMENQEAWQQYTASTSELGKWFSAATGGFMSKTKRLFSPVEAEHFIRATFGSAGAMAQWASNVIHDAVVGDERRPDLTIREMPIVGGFVTPPVPRGREDLFYDLKKLTDQKYDTFMALVDRNDKEAANAYLAENKRLVGYREYTNQVDAALKELNAEIRRVGELKVGEGSPLTSAGKRDKITKLQMKKNQVLKDIQKIRNDAMKDLNLED